MSYFLSYDENGNKVEKTSINGQTKTITTGTDSDGKSYVSNDGVTAKTTTDDFGRTTQVKTSRGENNSAFLSNYEYADGKTANSTTNLVSKLTQKYGNNELVNYEYTYDANGNITEIKENGTLAHKYTYDSLNQLYSEYDYINLFYISYSYDSAGNIQAKHEQTLHPTYLYPTGKDYGNVYYYNDTEWKDKLTKINSYDITYDASGNPLSYRDGMTFTWQNGRQLASLQTADNSVSYKYDSNGMRTQKTDNSGTTYYYYDSDKNLIGLTKGNSTLLFYYDSDGNVTSFKYNGTMYYYIKNLQGDIVKIINQSGTEVASYVYDAWGNIKSTTGNATLKELNPFRYRGYVYDDETGLYYLQSRYYDPFTGRFLNADDLNVLQLSDNEILSTNLYAYCGNNPISNSDLEGNWGFPTPAKLIAAALIGGLIGAACEAIIQVILEHRSLKTLKWGSIAIEFISGALTGALIACNFPASLTNLGRGVINMLTSLAHSIKNGKFKSISGAFKAIGSAILSGIITIIIGSVRATRGKTLNYTTVKNMIWKIGLNRVARGGFRIGIGWFSIKLA